MNRYDIGALFCEDIRIEKNGQETLVGVLSDNIETPQFPIILPKLGVYLRTRFSTSFTLTTFSVTLVNSGGEEQLRIDYDSALIEKVYEEAREKGYPFAGFKSVSIIDQVPVRQESSLDLFSIVNGERYLCAQLRIMKGGR